MKKELDKYSWNELLELEHKIQAAKSRLEQRLKEQFCHGDLVEFRQGEKNVRGVVKWRNSKTANMQLADGTMSHPIPWGLLRLVKKAQAEKSAPKKTAPEKTAPQAEVPKKTKKAMMPKTEAPIEKTEAPVENPQAA